MTTLALKPNFDGTQRTRFATGNKFNPVRFDLACGPRWDLFNTLTPPDSFPVDCEGTTYDYQYTDADRVYVDLDAAADASTDPTFIAANGQPGSAGNPYWDFHRFGYYDTDLTTDTPLYNGAKIAPTVALAGKLVYISGTASPSKHARATRNQQLTLVTDQSLGSLRKPTVIRAWPGRLAPRFYSDFNKYISVGISYIPGSNIVHTAAHCCLVISGLISKEQDTWQLGNPIGTGAESAIPFLFVFNTDTRDTSYHRQHGVSPAHVGGVSYDFSSRFQPSFQVVRHCYFSGHDINSEWSDDGLTLNSRSRIYNWNHGGLATLCTNGHQAPDTRLLVEYCIFGATASPAIEEKHSGLMDFCLYQKNMYVSADAPWHSRRGGKDIHRNELVVSMGHQTDNPQSLLTVDQTWQNGNVPNDVNPNSSYWPAHRRMWNITCVDVGSKGLIMGVVTNSDTLRSLGGVTTGPYADLQVSNGHPQDTVGIDKCIFVKGSVASPDKALASPAIGYGPYETSEEVEPTFLVGTNYVIGYYDAVFETHSFVGQSVVNWSKAQFAANRGGQFKETDPGFVNYAGGDYRLIVGSAGHNDGAGCFLGIPISETLHQADLYGLAISAELSSLVLVK